MESVDHPQLSEQRCPRPRQDLDGLDPVDPLNVAHQGEDLTRASCRSIPEFHITDALDQCAELLDHFGGHAAAAGFTIQNGKLPEVLERLKAIAKKELGEVDLRPVLNAEVEVSLSDLRPELLDDLELLQPTGYGNPDPDDLVANNVPIFVRGLRQQGDGE